jgi:hypothetical protein
MKSPPALSKRLAVNPVCRNRIFSLPVVGEKREETMETRRKADLNQFDFNCEYGVGNVQALVPEARGYSS